MLNKYIYSNGKKLRCGYTTGSCAAAAAKAAAAMLITREKVSSINIITPKGIKLLIDILDSKIENEYVSCAVKKDSGDDPDITDGIFVYAKVSRIQSGIEIIGGKGVGIVTKPGLDRPVGDYAINSVPRKMITEAVAETAEKYCADGGFKIEISVPGGELLSLKTFNPRMGIVGGISIIGTSGIVEPMSNSALIETIRTEERMRFAEGYRSLLLTVGNYSNNFIQREFQFPLHKSVLCSNFIGDAIDFGIELGFHSILIVGHIGKLVKLGAGIMNTHSSNADGRMDVLVTCGVIADVDSSYLKRITECVTVDAAIDILNESGCTKKVFDVLGKRTEYYLRSRVKNFVEIGAIMFSDKQKITIKTPTADKLAAEILEEYND